MAAPVVPVPRFEHQEGQKMIGRKKLLGTGASAAMLLAIAVPPATAAAAPAGHGGGLITNMATIQALRAEIRSGTITRTRGTTGCAAAHLRCDLLVLTQSKTSTTPLSTSAPAGYGATTLEQAYGVTGTPSTTDTIAIIDAGPDPKLESNLATYRAQYGLPACGTGCFTQENYLAGAPYKTPTSYPNTYYAWDVAQETSLDVDMASAACPQCKITEIQVPLDDALTGTTAHINTATGQFAQAVELAKKQGAAVTSISYGFPETAKNTTGSIA
jgi:subtilase family serine protease